MRIMKRGLIAMSLVMLCGNAWGQAPHKAQITFMSARNGFGEIFSMDTDGKNQRPVAEGIEGGSPAWSPDGRRIAFFSTEIEGVEAIYVMDADGSNLRLVYEGYSREFEWSPDSKQLVAAVYRLADERPPEFPPAKGLKIDIGVVEVDSGEMRWLTEETGGGYHPTWSPDGKRIAYVTKQDGVVGIYVMSAAGVIERRLTPVHIGCHFFDLAWSPDGREIAYSCRKVRDCTTRIYVMEVDLGRVRRLTDDCAIEDLHPAWSPDGKKIAVTTRRDGARNIEVMNANGTNREQLTYGANNAHPTWYAPSYSVTSVTPSGKLATTWGELKVD